MIRTAVSYTLMRESGSAQLELPELLPGINFFARKDAPFFSIQVVLGIVSDLFYRDGKYLPSSISYHENNLAVAVTDWHPTQSPYHKESILITLPEPPSAESCSLLLSIGVRYGIVGHLGTIEPTKHTGCAKVLDLV